MIRVLVTSLVAVSIVCALVPAGAVAAVDVEAHQSAAAIDGDVLADEDAESDSDSDSDSGSQSTSGDDSRSDSESDDSSTDSGDSASGSESSDATSDPSSDAESGEDDSSESTSGDSDRDGSDSDRDADADDSSNETSDGDVGALDSSEPSGDDESDARNGSADADEDGEEPSESTDGDGDEDGDDGGDEDGDDGEGGEANASVVGGAGSDGSASEVTTGSDSGAGAGGGSGPRLPPPTDPLVVGAGVVAAGALTRGAYAYVGSSPTGASRLAGTAVDSARGIGRLARDALGTAYRVLVAGYTKRSEERPLEQETRATIHDRVEDEPGIYLSELEDETDETLGTVRYHLKKLERAGLVTGAKIRGRRRFYPTGETPDALDAALDEDGPADVLRALARRGPASGSALADALDRDPSTVSHRLSRLAEDDLVVRERDGRAVRNRLPPEVEAAVAPVADAETETEAETGTETETGTGTETGVRAGEGDAESARAGD